MEQRVYVRKGNKSKQLSRVVWEEHNGKIPKGHIIHHKDSDVSNNKIENLECLSYSEHARLIKNKKQKGSINLKCKRCGYSWEYNGNSEWYASCPKCRTTINVRKQKEEAEKKVRKTQKEVRVVS